MQLYIGNKNYSSWSMRPWVLLKAAGIPFDEVMVRFGSGADHGPGFKNTILKVNPAGRVPVLVDDGLVVWDTLAIAEYLAEKFPQHALWPAERAARARARSVCAEMHSGFAAMRTHFSMNIEARLPEVGPRILQQEPAVRADVARIQQMWTALLDEHRGPYLFGARFTIADAYFAPVCTRLRTYGIPVDGPVAAYIDTVFNHPAVAAWVREALDEHAFVPHDEPYRQAPSR